MIATLLLLQAAAGAPQAAADIELKANVRARSVTVEKQGDAELIVTTSPDGGNVVDVKAPKGNGRRELRNVDVTVHAEARIGDPAAQTQNNPEQTETPSPQSR